MAERRPIEIKLLPSQKVYFASDQHFGAPNNAKSKIREAHFIDWLNSIKEDCGALFLLGDLFDFWHEYRHVVPKGFVRVLGKLAEIRDTGTPIYFFTGNHDLWITDYFEKELGFEVFQSKQEFIIREKLFLIAHGDGLGPGDIGYKRMKKLFTNPVARWLFRWLHPDIGIPLGNYFSRKNKLISGDEDAQFLGEDKEWLYQYAQQKRKEKPYNYFIFGHRHLPLELKVEDATYINLGDWIQYYTYAEMKGSKVHLKKYAPQEG